MTTGGRTTGCDGTRDPVLQRDEVAIGCAACVDRSSYVVEVTRRSDDFINAVGIEFLRKAVSRGEWKAVKALHVK